MFENKASTLFMEDDINEENFDDKFAQKKIDFWVELMRSIGMFFSTSHIVIIRKHIAFTFFN